MPASSTLRVRGPAHLRSASTPTSSTRLPRSPTTSRSHWSCVPRKGRPDNGTSLRRWRRREAAGSRCAQRSAQRGSRESMARNRPSVRPRAPVQSLETKGDGGRQVVTPGPPRSLSSCQRSVAGPPRSRPAPRAMGGSRRVVPQPQAATHDRTPHARHLLATLAVGQREAARCAARRSRSQPVRRTGRPSAAGSARTQPCCRTTSRAAAPSRD